MGLPINYFTITYTTLTDENSQGPEKTLICPSNICMYQSQIREQMSQSTKVYMLNRSAYNGLFFL